MREQNGRFLQSRTRADVKLSHETLWIDGHAVIQSVDRRHVPLSDAELCRVFCRPSLDASQRERLAKIAVYLDAGQYAEAVFLASTLDCKRQTLHLTADAAKANFNPAEPREHGEWASSGTTGDASANINHIQYRGYYHDFVLDDLLAGLAGKGSKCPFRNILNRWNRL